MLVGGGAMLRFEATPCPLILGADGTIRVKGSGVTLELVVGAFDAGATPEQIAHHCPSLSLATIYSVISYLLSQRAEVDRYMQKRAETARTLAAYA
jgi:uncharacterized protein (DUF433 family)